MSIRCTVISAIALALCEYAPAAVAQEDACSIMARNIRQDVLQSGTSVSQFEQQQRLVCSQDYETYQTARDAGGTVGVNIIDILDINLGGNSTQQDWSTR